MIQFATFPRTWSRPAWVDRIVDVFRRHQDDLSSDRAGAKRSSGELLAFLSSDLQGLGFRIEKLELSDRTRPHRPFSVDEPAAPHHNIDVYHPEWHCCIAIEDRPDWAAIDEDGVEPLIVANADTLCLAVRASASDEDRSSGSDYERALALAQVLYGRSRGYLPHRLVLIGY